MNKEELMIGDWVILGNNHNSLYQIEKIENYEYYLRHYLEGSMPLSFCNEDSIRLWTIQDAMDGDVLVVNNDVFIYAHRKQMYCIAVAHCFVDIAGDFYIDGEFVYVEYGKTTISPATKEQRDILFEKMKEAGYEWDAEKRELKKIVQNNNEESNEGNFDIAGLYYAKSILEKTLGKVEGYLSDDGILEHKSAINVVTKLCEHKNKIE